MGYCGEGAAPDTHCGKGVYRRRRAGEYAQPSTPASTGSTPDKCPPVIALTASTRWFRTDMHRRSSKRYGFPQADSVARQRSPLYLWDMRSWGLVFVVPAVAIAAIGLIAAADIDPVPLFTSEDLDRMFGPAPAQPSDPVDKSRPEDWRWVQEFIDRQYSRIDADRQFDLRSRMVDIPPRRIEPAYATYGGSVAWRLGYPASTWWDTVASRYSTWGRGAPVHPSLGRYAQMTCGARPRDHFPLEAQRSGINR